MESYIEITFVHNMLICIFAYYASSYFSLSKISNRFFYTFLLVEQLCIVLLYVETYYFLFYLLELVFTLFIFYHQYKKLLMYLCIKYLSFFTCMKFLGGSFHLLHYFVPSNVNVIGIWCLLLFAILVLKQKWSVYLRVSDFIYSMIIYADKEIKIRGFLDTGNQVILNDIPVLFLDSKYHDAFMNMKEEIFQVITLNKEEKLVCYLCDVKINRYKRRSYYICCDKRVDLEWGCKCLLNIEI